MELGAAKESTGSFLRRPLHEAAMGGNFEVARLLLEKGADVEAVDGMGQTSHAVALHFGHRAVARLLGPKRRRLK